MKKSWLVLLLCYFSVLSAENVAEFKQRVWNATTQIPGWCNEEKTYNFIDLVLEVKPQVCAEIGVYAGRSLFPVASALKYLGQGVVIGIDPWDPLECMRYLDPVKDRVHLQWWSQESRLEEMYQRCLNWIATYGLEKHCKIIRKTSQKAINDIDFIDILYIDGKHVEPISTQDVMLYLPKVRSGGYIWINDTTWDGMFKPWQLLAEACDVVKAINLDAGICVLFKKR